VLLPLAYILAGAGALLCLNLGLRAVAVLSSASFAKQGALQKSVQAVVSRYVRPAVVNAFGTDAWVPVKLEHILLAALLVVAVGAWRTSWVQAELMRKEARAAAKAAAAKKDGAAGGGGDKQRKAE
jgi:hypothetical protein